MSDPRKGLPNQLTSMTFDQASANECLADIEGSLKKYNCSLVFQQVFHNGIPVSGGFVVAKNAPDKVIIHNEGNA